MYLCGGHKHLGYRKHTVLVLFLSVKVALIWVGVELIFT